jgi:hypothetical protein
VKVEMAETRPVLRRIRAKPDLAEQADQHSSPLAALEAMVEARQFQ